MQRAFRAPFCASEQACKMWYFVAAGQRGGCFLKYICACARVSLWKLLSRCLAVSPFLVVVEQALDGELAGYGGVGKTSRGLQPLPREIDIAEPAQAPVVRYFLVVGRE